MIKVLMGNKFEDTRNSFLNLAVPSLMMCEPGTAVKTKVKEGLEVTLWDRWEYDDASPDTLLNTVIEHFESKHKLSCRDIFHGSFPLYLHSI